MKAKEMGRGGIEGKFLAMLKTLPGG